MSVFDLTLAMTAHAETVVAGPTFFSAEAALAPLEAAGCRVERLIGLDTASDACRAYLQQPHFDHWTKIEFEFADQGKSRNALAERAKGHWLAFLDGDDLFSENWLIEAVRILEATETHGQRTIVHPELMWQFDAGASVLNRPGRDDPFFSPYYFAQNNYYDALCAARREAWLEYPFSDRAIEGGFAFEDWQWGIETMWGGWNHVIAKDTIIFKRRRDQSQTHEAKGRSACIRAIEATAIDRVGGLGLAGSTAARPLLEKRRGSGVPSPYRPGAELTASAPASPNTESEAL